MKLIQLNSGSLMPILGYTASVYQNEAHIAAALQNVMPKLGLKRSDLFITSKLKPADQGWESCQKAYLQSLSDLALDHLDLYLIHWPGTQRIGHNDPQNASNRKNSWLAMEELFRQGKVKSIGVSNYTVHHMMELLSFCTVKPAVLQSEFHPHLVQVELLELCRKHNIHFQAYSSLGSTSHSKHLLKEPEIVEIAEHLGHSPSQILLKWAVQQDIGVIPKSTNPTHIKENMEIFDFELSEEEMAKINNLNKNHHYCWDPSTVF